MTTTASGATPGSAGHQSWWLGRRYVENGKRGINPDVLERLIVGMKLDDGQGDALRLARLVDGGRPPASNPVDAELASLKAEVAEMRALVEQVLRRLERQP